MQKYVSWTIPFWNFSGEFNGKVAYRSEFAPIALNHIQMI